MELKNIFSLIPIHFLNKLGLQISRCTSEKKIQMLNDLTIKSGLKKRNLSRWFLAIMFLLQEETRIYLLPLLPQGIALDITSFNKSLPLTLLISRQNDRQGVIKLICAIVVIETCFSYCCFCPLLFREFGQQSCRTPLKQMNWLGLLALYIFQGRIW